MNASAARDTMATITLGWIDEAAPEPLQAILSRQVEAWRDSPAAPFLALIMATLDVLQQAGAWEAERDFCILARELDPQPPQLRLALGRCLVRLGLTEAAREELAAVTAPPPLRAEALLELLRLGEAPDGTAGTLEALLLEDGTWGRLHAAWAHHREAEEGPEGVEAFATAWTGRWTVPPGQITEMALLAMLMGRPETARPLFAPLWHSLSSAHAGILGHFDGRVPPYTPEVEAALAARVESALALPEDGLARIDLGGGEAPPPDTSLLLITFADRQLANDLAAHYGQSARAAGLSPHVLADTALALPHEFFGTGAQIAGRLAHLEAELERLRPAVVVLDCLPPLGLRGLDPGRMAHLRRRHGFRLVALFRDAHAGAMPLIRAWAPACDTILVDIVSPAWTEAGLSEKAVPLVIPTQWGPYLEPAARSGGLIFIGAVNFQVRLALLSVLMTEIPGFRAIYGARRRQQAPDMASYARLLAGSAGVVNVSAHGAFDHLVTSRVWETLATGAPLVEQDNAATRSFLEPWRHFLPWRSVSELVHLGHFIAARPDLAARVAAEGHAWARRHYSPARVWGGILSHALRPRDEAELRAEEEEARGWHRFVFASPGGEPRP